MNSDHFASIARSERVCFDYMDFLSASCKKQWRFVDAIYGVMPIFGMVLKSHTAGAQTSKEQLKELALQVVSTQVSDETNILRLIDLAMQQQLAVFDIQLPYPLEAEQLAAIAKECADGVVVTQVGERITITAQPPAGN
ncbi:hypothetical protein ACQ86O_18915 [Serratia sp. L9]|uniref:hypothetical protein n=1 Tax=Serratia sp. L9 TaxID=3423946 RepID=UPI003D6690DB